MLGILKNCIVIDLTTSNYQNLGRIVDAAGIDDLSAEFLAIAKKDGYAKLFIDKNTVAVIAYTTKKDKQNIYFMDYIFDEMHKIESVKLKKTEVTEITVNKILEKITKSGKESLTKNEIETLDKYSTL